MQSADEAATAAHRGNSIMGLRLGDPQDNVDLIFEIDSSKQNGQ